MFDNICILTLASDILVQAINPVRSAFAVGLVSGHVETVQLPVETSSAPAPAPELNQSKPKGKQHCEPQNNSNHCSVRSSERTTTSPESSSTSSNSSHRSSLSRRSSSNGYSTITTLWRAHRHKRTCTALAFSTDGSTLFSAGTDGIIKAASAETGYVVGKTTVPRKNKHGAPDIPSCLLALSPKTLVVGTDTGAVHIYSLEPAHKGNSTAMIRPNSENKIGSASSACLTLSEKPIRTLRPHKTPQDPNARESISSLIALPPSSTSTSKVSRAFVTTAGTTVAVSDLFKGVVKCSVNQDEELFSSACMPLPVSNHAKKPSPNHCVLVGQNDGRITLWNASQWEDRVGTVVVCNSDTMPEMATVFDDPVVESVAAAPRGTRNPEGLVACGLGNGKIRLAVVDASGKKGKLAGVRTHDEQGIEGVTAVGFDVEGRLISAGGSVVKVWHLTDNPHVNGVANEEADSSTEDKSESSDSEMEDATVTSNGELGKTTHLVNGNSKKRSRSEEGEDEVPSSDGSAAEEAEARPRKKARRAGRKGGKRNKDQWGDHGVMGLKGLD